MDTFASLEYAPKNRFFGPAVTVLGEYFVTKLENVVLSTRTRLYECEASGDFVIHDIEKEHTTRAPPVVFASHSK